MNSLKILFFKRIASSRTLAQSDNVNIKKTNEKDYYNDLPGKLPPDLLCENEQLPQKLIQLNLKLRKPRDRLSSNLIDLNSPPADQAVKMDIPSVSTNGTNGTNNTAPVRDVFDIRKWQFFYILL